ncbi:MAG TPA: antibiotic biosynthesis monooxygenase [Sphingomonas sp.]|uniref:antibiotic biosynthesis monooxygenase family protein n=1 Tax=Sphingomonas sp. TaxID=28214 RepID=UPI002ED8FDFA
MNAISAGTVAVIFISQRTPHDPAGYTAAAAEMDAAAAAMPGYAGADFARDPDGFGITVSYWRDHAAAAAWRDDPRHREIQERGRARWYASYAVYVADITRGYRWTDAMSRIETKKKASPEGWP